MEVLTSQLISQIISTTFVYSEAVRRLSGLKSHLVSQIFGSSSTSAIDPENSQWLNSLSGEFLSKFNNANIYPIFESAEKILAQTNYLIIYLPFELPPVEAGGLASYLRTNFGSQFLFEIKYDPQLIGGCSLVWKGVYKDYSLKQKIADNHYSILKLLKEYV